jgi:hypothetical protein
MHRVLRRKNVQRRRDERWHVLYSRFEANQTNSCAQSFTPFRRGAFEVRLQQHPARVRECRRVVCQLSQQRRCFVVPIIAVLIRKLEAPQLALNERSGQGTAAIVFIFSMYIVFFLGGQRNCRQELHPKIPPCVCGSCHRLSDGNGLRFNGKVKISPDLCPSGTAIIGSAAKLFRKRPAWQKTKSNAKRVTAPVFNRSNNRHSQAREFIPLVARCATEKAE